jgi:alkylation response protein AidB-like acyl-CoA dehydrogenase
VSSVEFKFSDEQEELRREARSCLAELFPPERVAELADSAEGWDPASWRTLAELGWLGVAVPEELGGAGLGFVEQAILLEELARALYPGPYFSTVALALPALPPEEQARVAAGEVRWSAEVGGIVPDLAIVDRVVTDEGAAPATGAYFNTFELTDSTRRAGRLAPGPREPLAGRVDRTRMYTAVAAESIGIAQRAIDWSLEYAKTREQFGRIIGTYQAVAHPLADSFADTELARSLTYWAAWAVDAEPGEAVLAAAAAKAFATEAAVAACERAIQAHGGTGFTWEHPLHRYYKRALALSSFGGFPAEQRAELAAAILG